MARQDTWDLGFHDSVIKASRSTGDKLARNPLCAASRGVNLDRDYGQPLPIGP